MKQKPSGFTLIEILLVVALIALLAGIVIIAVNPNKQLADGRNARRRGNRHHPHHLRRMRPTLISRRPMRRREKSRLMP